MSGAPGEVLALASLRLGDHARGVLARLGGPLGHAAREVAAELAGLDASTRKQRRTQIVAAARAPVPVGFRAVHPTWIEALLAELPERARRAVAAGGGEATDVWLARWATADVPTMTGLAARPATELLAWLVAIGADQLAYALGAARARSIGTLEAACARITKPPRAGNLGPQRAAIARCRDLANHDELALVRVASRALAPHLAADQLARIALTRRLPRAIGIVVEAELAAHAATSLDQVPNWTAFVAP